MFANDKPAAKLSLSVSLAIAIHVLVLIMVIVIAYLQPASTGLPLPMTAPPSIIQATMVSTKALAPAPHAEKAAPKPMPAPSPKQIAPSPPQKVEKAKPKPEDALPQKLPLVTKPTEIKAKPPVAKSKTAPKHKSEHKVLANKPAAAVDLKQQQLKQQQLAEQRKQALKALGEQSLAQAVAAQQATVVAQQLAAAQDAYKSQISTTVAGAWINPFQDSNQMQLLVAVTIDTQGKVLNAVVTQSSGNDIFDRQALLAIHKAAPFTPPPVAQGQTQFTFYLKFLNNNTVGAS